MRRPKTHPCAGPRCREPIPTWTHICQDCWRALPGWLRHQLYAEKQNCKAAQIKHSQELLRLQGYAVQHLTPKPQAATTSHTSEARA